MAAKAGRDNLLEQHPLETRALFSILDYSHGRIQQRVMRALRLLVVAL